MTNEKYRERTGNEISKDKLIGFLYLLVRDHITPGKLEKIMLDISNEKEYHFTNGFLARYVKDVKERLK